MAITTGSDISIVLSGGSDNLTPDSSIGGAASITPITDETLNNLFNDVSSEENAAGVEDYRCIYIFNDGDTTVYSGNVFIHEDFTGGATMAFGIEDRDENQRLLIVGTPTGGSITLSYEGQEIVIPYNSDLGVMALDLQDKLNALVVDDEQLLRNVVVTGQPTSSSIIFDMLFTGEDGSRSHAVIQIASNDLTPSVTTTVSKTQIGAPINTTASEIGNSTIPPGGVSFFAPSESDAIVIPKLRSTEGFPLWIKRTVEANTEAKANDGFVLRFRAESLPLGD